MQAGLPNFVLSATEWIEKTHAAGIIVRKGRYGGTYAVRDLAFEFGTAISVAFKLYLIEEFQRLKEEEQKHIGWSAKRELAKINYRIHTDAIKQNLVPPQITPKQASLIYADEADVLNVAMFGLPLSSIRCHPSWHADFGFGISDFGFRIFRRLRARRRGAWRRRRRGGVFSRAWCPCGRG